jgi:RNA polymerase sigma-70 factor (ECF subfamily)
VSNTIETRKENAAVEDAYLVALCKKGNLNAFEKLVHSHQKKMINIAYRMIGNYEDACEVVQDAFVSAYRSIQKFQEKSSFATWLCAIVMNLSRNRLKQIRTRQHHEPFSVDDPVISETGKIKADPPSREPSVLERIEIRDIRLQIQGCIEGLETEFREVVVLRDIQSFSYGEISDMLKIPEGTVKSRLFRAREALKDCLKQMMGVL